MLISREGSHSLGMNPQTQLKKTLIRAKKLMKIEEKLE